MTITAPTPATEIALTPGERRHLTALEKRIERGLQTFREVGAALMEVRDSRLYRENYTSFEAYCRDRWQLERQRAYQLIGAVEVVEALPKGDQDMIRNEATARELVPVMRGEDPDALKTVWARIKDQINTGAGEAVTAEVVRRVKAEVLPPRANLSVNLYARLVAESARLRTLYAQWIATGPDRKERRNVDSAIRAITQV